VHSTGNATAFVRDLFAQHGDAVADLEVRRASLEDTYIALVREVESGQVGQAVKAFAGPARSAGGATNRDEFEGANR
jgi:ABC-2 type transport system ATP-binding protein